MIPNAPSSKGRLASGFLQRVLKHWLLASNPARWGGVAAYALLIFYLSSRNRLPGAMSHFPDKLGHGMLYAMLGLLIARALTKPRGLSKISRGLMAMGLATLYGATDEWHQSFVPGRTAEWGDLLADFLGAAVGTSVYLLCIGLIREPRTHTRG